MFRKIESGVHFMGNIFMGLGGVLLFILMLLGASDVAGRYLFNRPIRGTFEASEVLMAGAVLLTWAYTQRTGGNVRVELFVSRYPTRVRAIATFITLLLALVLFIAVTQQSFLMAMKFLGENRVFQTIPGPSAPYHFFVPVGGFFLCLEFIFQLIHLVPEMRKAA